MSSTPDEGPPRSGNQSPQGKDDPTIVLPQGAGQGTRFSVPTQGLSDDKLLLGVPRINFENRNVPALGGIPLIAKIGQGGMGAVYLGYKIMLKREVAVKVLPLHLAQQQPQLVERFLREAQIAAKIQSPHLVHVSDVNQSEGLFYITMEYVNGLSAGAYLKKAVQAGEPGLDEATALDLCIAATTGLAAAHAEGVIHRDVKPDNVLVPQDRQGGAFLFGSSKIADLGLARAEDVGGGASLTRMDSGMGTPGYMAPEQARNARKAGKPADVFSMGATLYALLSGQAPFRGETPTETILATIQQPHAPIRDFRSDVSGPTAELIERCLSKDLTARYADASALLRALQVCRAALGEGQQQQSQAIHSLIALQQAPEVGRAVPPSSGPGAPTLPPSEAVTRAPHGTAPASTPPPGSAVAVPVQSGRRSQLVIGAILSVLVGAGGWLLIQGMRTEGTPQASVVEVGIAYGREKAEWLTWASQQFAQTPEGKAYALNLMAMSSTEAQAALQKDDSRIHVWVPASGLVRDAFVQSWRRRHTGNAIEREEQLALTPLVFIMFEDRYQAFVKQYKRLSFQTLGQAFQETTGWEGIAQKKEWGRFTFALSDPREHNNGLAALMLVANHLFQKDQGLSAQEIEAQSFQTRAMLLQRGFATRGSPMQMVRDMVLRGPSMFDGAFTYESAVISNLASAEGRWGGVRLTYPEINFWNDNPYYILAAPWSSEAQKAGATAFLEFLMTEPIQKQLLEYGFRPGNPRVPIIFPDSPFERYKREGLRVDIPRTAENPPLGVLEALQKTAQRLADVRK